MARHPVIISGAGPSGLSAALFLIRQGVPVLVIDRNPEMVDDPRAATFHPPTLEILEPSGVTGRLLEQGIIAQKWQSRERTGGVVAEFDLAVLAGETRYPFRVQCEQHKLVAILHEMLAGSGLELHAGESILAVEQKSDHVVVRTDRGEYETEWLVGADGGRSAVRKSQPFAFEGFTYPERFLVITNTYDFELDGYAFSNYVGDPDEWCAVFKVPAEGPPGLWRAVFPTDPAAAADDLTAIDAARVRLTRFVPTSRPFQITHTNLYTVHQRVADRFRLGRVVLIGDAAHLNNPLGGMGMNFGIQDAENFARAFAEMRASGDDAPLDRFDRQRRTAANDFLQAMTIQNKAALEERDPAIRAKQRDELRRIAADPALTYAYLMRTSMIEGLRHVNELT